MVFLLIFSVYDLSPVYAQWQKVEWLNSLLQTVWPMLSAALEVRVKEQLQPQLDEICPKILGRLALDTFSLGAVAPKIVGVNLQVEGATVRVDVELRWGGDPFIRLSVGTPVATPIEVSDVRFSAVARIELVGLGPFLPCFKAATVTVRH